MAFASSMVWEVRQDGNAANGGGFDPTSGTPGTDYSQQAAAQVAYTDLVIDGTTATNCTSAGTPFTSAHVGNIINITGGTGFTVQRVQIMSVAAGVATCDKSLGTLSSTGGTGNLGGALATWQALSALVVAGNKAFVKYSASYAAQTATWALTPMAGSSVSGVYRPVVIASYDTDRTVDNTDSNRTLITTATNSTALITGLASNHIQFWNFRFSNTAGTRAAMLANGTTISTNCQFWRCKFDGFTSVINETGSTAADHFNASLYYCELTNCTGFAIQIYSANMIGAWMFVGNYIHNNAGGFNIPNLGSPYLYIVGNIIANNSARGILWAQAGSGATAFIVGNIFYKNTTADFGMTGSITGDLFFTYVNNIHYGSTASFSYGSGKTPVGVVINNASDTAFTNITDLNRITLTGDPFTDGSNPVGDFSLNNTAGAGAACKSVGLPTALPGGSTANYLDLGAMQAVPTAPGGGGETSHVFIG